LACGDQELLHRPAHQIDGNFSGGAILRPWAIIEVVLGDITEQNADAIVTAANDSLLSGGATAGAAICGASACRSSPSSCWSPTRWYRRSLPLDCTHQVPGSIAVVIRHCGMRAWFLGNGRAPGETQRTLSA
jgi:hypothetical protein